MYTRLYVDMYSKSPVCKTTSKHDYNSIRMFKNLHVYKFTCLLIYKNNTLQKNNQKRGGIACDITYLTTPASLNF